MTRNFIGENERDIIAIYRSSIRNWQGRKRSVLTMVVSPWSTASMRSSVFSRVLASSSSYHDILRKEMRSLSAAAPILASHCGRARPPPPAAFFQRQVDLSFWAAVVALSGSLLLERSKSSSSSCDKNDVGTSYQHRVFSNSLERSNLPVRKTVPSDDAGPQPAAAQPSTTRNRSITDVYPNFTRHGRNALLPKYLTEEVFAVLKDKETSNGVRLEDIIRSGVSLPWGARPPRGIAGVYVGDAESYRVFSALLTPLIDSFHRSRRRTGQRLQRHQSDLDYTHVLSQVLDPDGEYILYTRMRLARSVEGFRFGPCISREERRKIESLLMECAKDWETGQYVSVMEMTNSQHDDLIQRRVLFPDPDDFAISAGLGRDWPDARGIYCDTWKETPDIVIWCNAEDHLSIISTSKGGDVREVFTKLSQAAWALETSLRQRGHAFIEDRRLGFLNTSPTNIGTGLRASVYVKLVRLSNQPGFFELVRRLRLEARSEYSQTDKRFTGIYDIANAEALGKSEVDLINIMIRGVGILIDLEKRLERGEEVDLENTNR